MNDQPEFGRHWFCPQCGNSNLSTASFCIQCGGANPFASSGNIQRSQQPSPYPHYQQPPQQQMQQYGAPIAPPVPGYPGAMMMAPAKNRLAYILLGIFLGGLGIHNFYAGRNSSAVAQLLITLLTFWLIVPIFAVWIWVIVELVTVDKDGRGIPMN